MMTFAGGTDILGAHRQKQFYVQILEDLITKQHSRVIKSRCDYGDGNAEDRPRLLGSRARARLWD